jgi:hypothetical protein
VYERTHTVSSHTLEYYSAMNRNEALATWRDPKVMVLSERSRHTSPHSLVTVDRKYPGPGIRGQEVDLWRPGLGRGEGDG